MINQDEQLKGLLEKLRDKSGKIIVTDDMSDDLKKALTTINEENIDIFSPKYSEEELEKMDNDEFEDNDVEELDSVTDFDDNSTSVDMADNIVEDNSVDVSDLNDLF